MDINEKKAKYKQLEIELTNIEKKIAIYQSISTSVTIFSIIINIIGAITDITYLNFTGLALLSANVIAMPGAMKLLEKQKKFSQEKLEILHSLVNNYKEDSKSNAKALKKNYKKSQKSI